MKNKKVETKTMNPIWVVLVFAVLIIVIICKSNMAPKGEGYKIEEIYQAHKGEVDMATQALFDNATFMNLNQSEKVAEMGKLLALYEQAGIIENLYYSGDNYMYTFTYNTEPITGALGGVSLKEWNPYMN